MQHRKNKNALASHMTYKHVLSFIINIWLIQDNLQGFFFSLHDLLITITTCNIVSVGLLEMTSVLETPLLLYLVKKINYSGNKDASCIYKKENIQLQGIKFYDRCFYHSFHFIHRQDGNGNNCIFSKKPGGHGLEQFLSKWAAVHATWKMSV